MSRQQVYKSWSTSNFNCIDGSDFKWRLTTLRSTHPPGQRAIQISLHKFNVISSINMWLSTDDHTKPNNISLTVRLYADDVILYATINSIKSCHKLQKDVATLTKWANKWKMTFNVQKWDFIRITHKKRPIFTNILCIIMLCRRLHMPHT